MAIFDFLKRKERELPLPPPPLPPSPQGRMQGDFEQIRPPAMQELREWQQPMMQEEHHDEEMNAPLPPLPPMPPLMEEHEEGHHNEQLLLPAPPAGDEEVVYDRTVQAQRSETSRPAREPQVQSRALPKKTFVSVNDYKQILTETNMVRQRLMSADNFVKKLTDLKQEEERSLERWRSQLEDVEKKLAYVDQLIEKAQR